MLGQALVRAAVDRGLTVSGAARSGTDVTVDLTDAVSIRAVFDTINPDVVVNTAAMTEHDACEHDIAAAYTVNARAVAFLAEECRNRGCRLVQISTDQYFSGDADALHDETHPISCLPSEYARTKLAGERFAQTAPDALILRTNITGLRGLAGKPTFIEWVFTQAEAGAPFILFNDYFCSTIDTKAFAEAALDLVDKGVSGLLHVGCREVSSKQTFILEAVECLTGRPPAFTSSSVKELPTLRAESAGLNVSLAEAELGRALPTRRAVISALVEAWHERH